MIEAKQEIIMVILLTLLSKVHTLSTNIYCHDKIDLVFGLSREIHYGLTNLNLPSVVACRYDVSFSGD